MDAMAIERAALEGDLRRALALGQFEMRYQPLLRSHGRTLSGFEALLHWRHPTRGLMRSGEFESLAVELGLIGEIGAWTVREACMEAANWPDNLKVAVNLSPRQFRDLNLVGTIADAIKTAGISAERVRLEITELVPLREDRAALATLRELRALGALIVLDKFGTGNSSIAYVQSFPFDTIKLDRSIVSRLRSPDNSMAITLGIIGLATTLGMNVAAEGVETEEQFEFLAGAGCSEIEGFPISDPAPARDIPVLIERLSAHDAALALASG
jgi:EAL domain-containing protein (putative c-di-GMP-specific phosphodiesterase class I)